MQQENQAPRSEVDQFIDRWFRAFANFWWFWRRHYILSTFLVGGFLFWLLIVRPSWQDDWWQYVVIVGYFMFQLAFAVVFMIIQFGALFWFLSRGRVYWLNPGETGVGFQDYRGQPEVLENARRVVTLLRGVKEFKQMGGEVSRGVLFTGPPGTGKSYLAQAIATEAGVPFAYASAPGFQNMFLGIGNLRVMFIYRKARKKAAQYGGCIIFIDEIDAIGQSRASGGQNNSIGMGPGGFFGGGGFGLLNELLLQMDPPNMETSRIKRFLRMLGLRQGKAKVPPVLTIAATNLPHVLDAALLRPGRFDRTIAVEAPDSEGRKDIIMYYLAKVKHEDMPLDKMVSDTVGYTPVSIKYAINEAVVLAHFDGRSAMTYWDFTQARLTHEMGLQKPIRGMSMLDRRRIAYHEAGHAVAAIKLMPRHRIAKVTIVRQGDALGFVEPKPREEIHTKVKEDYLADIQVSLASRAAEEIFLGIKMSGVTGDLQHATQLAAMMVGLFGMEGSLVSLAGLGSNPFGGLAVGERERQAIDKILSECFVEVKKLLQRYHGALEAIAELLLEKNEIDGDEAYAIVARYEKEVLANRNGVLPNTSLLRVPETNGHGAALAGSATNGGSLGPAPYPAPLEPPPPSSDTAPRFAAFDDEDLPLTF